MNDRVYKVMDDACETMSELSGVKIRFPRATQNVLKVSAASNVVAGTALIAYGITSAHKWTIALGAIGLANSLYLTNKAREKSNNDNE